MQIYVIIINRQKTVTIEIESSDEIIKIKERVEEKVGVPIFQQRMIFRGKQLKEDRKTLEHYKIYSDSTLHCIVREGYYPEGLCSEMDNFHEILDILIRRKKVEQQEGIGLEITKFHSTDDHGVESIIHSGINGPLVRILEFLDTVHLLFLTDVCKSFYETIHKMIVTGIKKLNDTHIHIILGQKKMHISESLFLKLASYPDNTVFSEETIVCTEVPKFCVKLSDKYNLLQICVEKKFIKGLKFLVEDRNFTKLQNVSKTGRYDYLERFFQTNRLFLSDTFSLSEEEVEIILYLLDNLHHHQVNNSVVPKEMGKVFIRMIKCIEEESSGSPSKQDVWPYIKKFLKYGSEGDVRSKFIHSYSAIVRKYPQYATLSRWLEIEGYLLESLFSSNELLSFINSCLGYLEWDLFEYFLEEFFVKHRSTVLENTKNNPNFRWTINQTMAKRKEFKDYILDDSKPKKFLLFYKPRFIIERECLLSEQPNISKIKELVKNFNRELDIIHSNNNKHFLEFPFQKIQSEEIFRLVVPLFPIIQDQYIEMIKIKKNFVFGDLMEPFFELFHVRIVGSIVGGVDYLDLINCNLDVGRNDVGIRIFKNYSQKILNNSNLNRYSIRRKLVDLLMRSIVDDIPEIVDIIMESLKKITPCNNTVYSSFFDILKKGFDDIEIETRFQEAFERTRKRLLELISYDEKIIRRNNLYFSKKWFKNCVEMNLFECAKLLMNKKGWENSYCIENFFHKNKNLEIIEIRKFFNRMGITEYYIDCFGKNCREKMDIIMNEEEKYFVSGVDIDCSSLGDFIDEEEEEEVVEDDKSSNTPLVVKEEEELEEEIKELEEKSSQYSGSYDVPCGPVCQKCWDELPNKFKTKAFKKKMLDDLFEFDLDVD